MKLSVLVDNNTLIGNFFIGEPGLSFLITDQDKQILFDTGYSDAFILNSMKMNLNVLNSDFIVLSHGHLDHTWGLRPLITLMSKSTLSSPIHKTPIVIAHPNVFESKFRNDKTEIGSCVSQDELSVYTKMNLSASPVWLTDRLVFLGEIERVNDYENQQPLGKVFVGENETGDYVRDDTALAYKSEKGLVIIAGCSHSGICNIIDYARKVCNEEKVADVIGGFHLLQPSAKQLQSTLSYFEKLNPVDMHPCHCIDLDSKIALSTIHRIKEVGVGMQLSYV